MEFVSVTPLQKEDEEKAMAMEKFYNYLLDKLVEIPEFRKQFTRQCLLGGFISKEELEGYFNKVIENA